jgi:hypothetical protein
MMRFDDDEKHDFKKWVDMRDGADPYPGIEVISFICNNCGGK